MELTPKPIDPATLPPIKLKRDEITIEGNRKLYSYSEDSSNQPSDGATVTLNSNPEQDV